MILGETHFGLHYFFFFSDEFPFFSKKNYENRKNNIYKEIVINFGIKFDFMS